MRAFALTRFIMNPTLFFHISLYKQPEQESMAEILQLKYWIGVVSSREIIPKRIICIICAISLLQFVFYIKTEFCAILLTSFNFSYISDSLPYTTYPSCCVSDKCG